MTAALVTAIFIITLLVFIGVLVIALINRTYPCSRCKGSGTVLDIEHKPLILDEIACPICKGNG